jgi:drug/metabolite transporter (DMT)-like permease
VRFDPGAFLILLSAFSTILYFVFQKPYLEKYNAIEFTSYSIWEGTFFILVFLPDLPHAMYKSSLHATLAVAYLGVFPTALAYFIWTYVLSRIPASNAVSFLYPPLPYGWNPGNFRGFDRKRARQITLPNQNVLFGMK